MAWRPVAVVAGGSRGGREKF